MSDYVHTRQDADIFIVTIDNPPVNALGHAVREGLCEALRQAQADAAVRAVLIVGAGGRFAGGADIREFGKARQAPLLDAVCVLIEDCDKPVVAAIDGVALGGGLEVALAAHYRLAVPGAKLGLPEVQLGLLPGAGGTQRTPRLIGVKAALDLMLSGRPLDAEAALALGLVDRLGADACADGMAYARELLDAGAGPRRSREATAALADDAAHRIAIDATRAELPRKFRGLSSPQRIVDCVEAALDLPFQEGSRRERDAFLECLSSPQHKGLVHAFFAERAVAKVPEADAAPPRPIAQVGVIGGGTMGAGIAVALLDAGLRVTMVERDAPSLARGRAHVEKVYDTQVAKGRMRPQDREDRLSRLSGSAAYDALGDADVVIEAVFEDMAVKHVVFAELDRFCKHDALLATNTSYLDIEAIAAATSRAQDVIGLHFFSPANVMRLLEVVVPRQACAEAVATGFALARMLRKVPVRAGVCDGFIGNRLLSVYRRAADGMLEDGASPYQIDEALREFGFAMGPFQVSDLAGGDIAWATRKRRAATRDPRERYVHIADRLCERGWFGQKTGRGWYRYAEGGRSGSPDPEVLAIVDAERRRAGIAPRTFAKVDIVRRYLAAMINEGADVVREGIALRPLDVDVVLINGYGFPRHHGGPMHYADMLGLDRVLGDIREFAREDANFWTPSPLLINLAGRGATFGSLNSVISR